MDYRFTYPNSKLTEEQKEFYERNGYILVKNNIRETLIDKITQRFIDICENRIISTNVKIIMKEFSLMNKGVTGQDLIYKIQDFFYDDIFWEFAKTPELIDIVEDIIGPNITAVHSMIINKPPNCEAEASLHPMHQDLYYFPFRPANKIVATWTALERADEINGCLYVIPGSHQATLYKHDYGKGYNNITLHQVHGLDHLPRVNIVMEKGDTLYFHPLLLHGSGPNFTKGFRKCISCFYVDSKNCHFINLRGTIQEKIADELTTLYSKRGGPANYVEIWKHKSRLVKGTPGCFQDLTSHL